jgi:hypothetical protein
MFGQASAGLNPDPPARQAAREALDVLAATIRRRPDRDLPALVRPPPHAGRLRAGPRPGLPRTRRQASPGSRPAADYQAILRAAVTGWQHATPY